MFAMCMCLFGDRCSLMICSSVLCALIVCGIGASEKDMLSFMYVSSPPPLL
jgi:hypothetical protein